MKAMNERFSGIFLLQSNHFLFCYLLLCDKVKFFGDSERHSFAIFLPSYSKRFTGANEIS